MTQAGGTPYFCRKCNKPVGERWLQCCPHKDCRAFNTIAAGKPAANPHAFIDQVPQRACDIKIDPYQRIPTGTREFDRVLGGGLVIGSSVLISGDPGIGKSTLLIQSARDLTVAEVTNRETGKLEDPYKVLYVSAEETVAQVKSRLDRVGPGSKELYLFNQANVIEIDRRITEIDPDVVIIDSIQTMLHPDIEGTAGSVTQVRACADYLVGIFKSRDIGAFLVGHITKEGVIAGPKVVEHLVDAVLHFGKEGQRELRSLRAEKNRFGDTNEMALFRMTRDGLKSIENPSELLLEHHMDGKTGMCVAMAATGPRSMAVEVQALLDGVEMFDANDGESPWAAKSKRPPKRYVTGMDAKRVNQVIAVLSRRTDIPIKQFDAYVNIAGGVKLDDTGLDLPLALALISQAQDTAMPMSFCAFGEIGLLGEIRPVPYLEARIKAAALMGFERIIGPYVAELDKDKDDDDADDLPNALTKSEPPAKGADDEDATPDGLDKYIGVQSIEEVLEILEFEKGIRPKSKQSKKPKKKKRSKAKNGQAASTPVDGVVAPEERT